MKLLLNASHRAWMNRLLVSIVILAIATAISLSNYVTGNWGWATPPKVPHQSQLNAVKEEGIVLNHWTTTEHYAGEISGYDWSVQALVPDGETTRELVIDPDNPAIVLLRPQTWHRDMPQVEWMDINGVQQWTTDQQKRVTFTLSPPPRSAEGSGSDFRTSEWGDRPIQVNARFFRGWTRQQTYAVMQWYAWPTGGSPSASQWFWADQLTQLRDHHRMPWVAVSIMVPIKPLGDSQTARSTLEDLGQQVQATLIQDVFSEEA
jgi:cyanoexosortase B-associated protein